MMMKFIDKIIFLLYIVYKLEDFDGLNSVTANWYDTGMNVAHGENDSIPPCLMLRNYFFLVSGFLPALKPTVKPT